ncbi:MAG TPA: hypothetical protein V6C58_10745 [Allocoleopsis sp.]
MNKVKGYLNQKFLIKTMFLSFLGLCWCETAFADSLKTKSFIINIKRNCQEGEVICNKVSYTGTDLKTKKSIKLTGKTVYRICSDKVTPCQFLGYEFLNGDYRYFVTESGTLQVFKKGKLVLKESGNWKY